MLNWNLTLVDSLPIISLVFQLFDSFYTKPAKTDPQWQISAKKCVRLAQNSQFGHFGGFSPK